MTVPESPPLDLDALEGERLKATQVAQHGEPATRWWAARFLDALDAVRAAEAERDTALAALKPYASDDMMVNALHIRVMQLNNQLAALAPDQEKQ